MIMEFHEFAIHKKLMKQGIYCNQNQVIRSQDQRDPIFKINKNSNQILAKMKNKSTLNSKLTV